MNYRHFLAATCATAVTLGVVAAPAEAAVDPVGRECKAATAAAKLGQPIPNIGNFVFGPQYNAIDGNLVRIYAPDKYKPYITQATDQWSSGTGGLIRFEYVNQPGYKVVTVREANLGSYVVGRVQGSVDNMELLLNPDILRNGYIESLVMTITHELGHAMGLAHSCDGALMKDGSNRGKVAKTLQPLDVQVLIQANNLKQYGGRPLTSTTTSAAPSPVPTLEEAQASLIDAHSALTAAQRDLAAAQAKYDAVPNWQLLSKSAAAQELNAAKGEVARAELAVQTAEALVAKLSPATTAPATTAPATSTSSEPTPEPTTTTSDPAPEPPSQTDGILPKPTSRREAEDMFQQAQGEYLAALQAKQQAEASGIGIEEATKQFETALQRYGQASENRREYIAAHPDEALPPTTTVSPTTTTSPATSVTSTASPVETTVDDTTSPGQPATPTATEEPVATSATSALVATTSEDTTILTSTSEATPSSATFAVSPATTSAAETTTTTPEKATERTTPAETTEVAPTTTLNTSTTATTSVAATTSEAATPTSAVASTTGAFSPASETAAAEATTKQSRPTATSATATSSKLTTVASTDAKPTSPTPAATTSVTTTPERHEVVITGEHKATTIQAWPTATTQREETSPTAQRSETTTPTSTHQVPEPTSQLPAQGTAVEGAGGSSVAGIVIPIVVVLLAALGAAGWAYMNGLI
ncbi:hypothetical protein QQO25_02810 [Corynebacterium lehmanniae]|nr:hypothetical protein [Corynebacterium lehmanniae]